MEAFRICILLSFGPCYQRKKNANIKVERVYIQEMLRCIGSLISGLQGSNAQVYDAVRQSKQILTWFDI
jgi:hypothetical protein